MSVAVQVPPAALNRGCTACTPASGMFRFVATCIDEQAAARLSSLKGRPRTYLCDLGLLQQHAVPDQLLQHSMDVVKLL